MEEKTSYTTLRIREETTPTLNTSPPPVTDVSTGGPSTRSPGTDHIEHRRTEAIAAEHIVVGHTPLSDVGVLSPPSRSPVLDDFLPIGMPLPLDSSISLSERASFSLESNSQILALAASGLSRSWDPSVAVEGEENAKGSSCQGKGKDEPPDDVTVTLDVPARLLAPRPIVDVTIASPSSRSSLDKGKYPPYPHDQYDVV